MRVPHWSAHGGVVVQVDELQKTDAATMEALLLGATRAEKLVAGKMTREEYIEVEEAASKRAKELAERSDALLQSLA